MRNVLVTGSSGVIGTVLQDNTKHNITAFDLPDYDALSLDQLIESAKGHDAIVHLGWNTKTDNYKSDYLDVNNTQQMYNVYSAAVEAGVGRVIMASSVNANKFTGFKPDGLLDPYALPLPNSLYGANKVAMEAMGRYFADAKGLEVICVRFGGVNPGNAPYPQDDESRGRQVWLSHADCASLIDKCVEAELTPGKYEIINAVSDNARRLHDISNTYGWHPVDGAK